PLILARGVDWYRAIGTPDTPGPLVCTVVGDVEHAGYGEAEPGTPLREVIDRLGGGIRDGRRAKAALAGQSNPVLTRPALDPPASPRPAAGSAPPASSSTTRPAACSRSPAWCRASSTSSRAVSAGRASTAVARSPAASTTSPARSAVPPTSRSSASASATSPA